MGSTSFLRSRFVTPALLAGVSVLLFIRLFLLVYQKAVNILFWDQWGFLTPLFSGQTGWALFTTQAGSHRMGIGYFLIQLLAAWTHWNTRADSFAILALVVLAMLAALVLKRRVFGSFSAWDVLIPLIFLTTAQYEIFIGVPDESAGGFPLFLLVLFCLAWTINRGPIRIPVVLMANFLLIFTGYGYLIAPVTISIFALDLVQAIRSRATSAAIGGGVGLVISTASILYFFRGFQLDQASQCPIASAFNLVKYPLFMGVTFAKFVGFDFSDQRWLSMILGSVLVLIVFGTLVYQGLKLLKSDRLENKVSLAVVILAGYSLIFSLSAAVGRNCLGMTGASASRYMTLIIPAFLALYFAILASGKTFPIRIALGGLAIIVLFGQLPFRGHDVWVLNFFSEEKASWKTCYLAYEDVGRCDKQTNFKIFPDNTSWFQNELAFLKANHLNLYQDHLPQK